MSPAVNPSETALSARRIGEQCRATGLGIVNNAHRWGKAELAGWLAGPYRRVTEYATDVPAPPSEVLCTPRRLKGTLPFQEAAREASTEEAGEGGTSWEVAPEQVDALLAQLREEVICIFQNATLEKIDSVARACMKHGFVVERTLPDGTELYLPVSQPRMRLLERVVSLFAADALMWPGAYSTVRICDVCHALTFGNCSHAPSGWRAQAPRIPRED